MAIIRINNRFAINTDKISAVETSKEGDNIFLLFYDESRTHKIQIPDDLKDYWYDYYTHIIVEMVVNERLIQSSDLESSFREEMGFRKRDKTFIPNTQQAD